MRFARGLRRLRARWRLHRIEWEAMHRPLEPPPGYEHFHTKEAVFPGLRDQKNKPKSFGEFCDALRGAWKLYRHDFIPDPEIQRLENQIRMAKERKTAEDVDEVLEKGEQMVREGRDMAERFVGEVKNHRPEIEGVVKDRLGVLRKSIHEFAEGYQETVNGARNVWGVEMYKAHLVREDNKPLVYESRRTEH